MKIEFTGTVTEILPTTVRNQTSGVKEREFRCTEESEQEAKYPNLLPFSIVYFPKSEHSYDHTGDLDKINVGDRVHFTFALSGRLWQPKDGRPSRVITSNRVISKIEVLSPTGNQSVPSPDMNDVPTPPAEAVSGFDDDNLPF